MSDGKRKISNKKSNDGKGTRVYPPSTHRVHLKTYEDVRRLLSGTINDLRQLKVDPVVARPVMYGCAVLLQVFEGKILEKDIRELQQIAKDRFGYGGY